MKFAMSYSFGKDSALALYKMIQNGQLPVCLITTFNPVTNRSFVHGVSLDVIKMTARSLQLPVLLVQCTPSEYEKAFEQALIKAKVVYGAEACAFGDIDVYENIEWDRARCSNTGLLACTPLFGFCGRKEVISCYFNSGFKAIIKCVQRKYLTNDFLGKQLTPDLASEIMKTGACICGENGEYHTLVIDGPIYKFPIDIELGMTVDFENYSAINVRCSL